MSEVLGYGRGAGRLLLGGLLGGLLGVGGGISSCPR